MMRIEAKVDMLQANESERQQTRRVQENHGESDLADNQKRVQSLLAATFAHRERSLLQSVLQVEAYCMNCRREAENDGCDMRR